MPVVDLCALVAGELDTLCFLVKTPNYDSLMNAGDVSNCLFK